MQIAASDHETAVTARGTRGPAVVLVHSLGLDRRMWDPVLDRLAEGRRVFAYDVRGHGSAAGAPLPFTMAATAADLLAVLDALEVDTAHVADCPWAGRSRRPPPLPRPAASRPWPCWPHPTGRHPKPSRSARGSPRPPG